MLHNLTTRVYCAPSNAQIQRVIHSSTLFPVMPPPHRYTNCPNVDDNIYDLQRANSGNKIILFVFNFTLFISMPQAAATGVCVIDAASPYPATQHCTWREHRPLRPRPSDHLAPNTSSPTLHVDIPCGLLSDTPVVVVGTALSSLAGVVCLMHTMLAVDLIL